MSTRQEKRDLLDGWSVLFNACKCLAEQSCEDNRWSDLGDYHAYTLLRVLRNELADKMYTVGKR